MKVIIVGGGIGGLVAGMSLQEAGLDVTIYESVREVRPLGVGINILPHSVRILNKLGLVPDLLAISIPNEELIYFNQQGQKIWREPRGLAAGYNVPQLSIHRGYLQLALMREATKRLGAARIKTGHHLKRFEYQEGASGVSASFVDPDTQEAIETVSADVLIGADGIHSTVRAQLYPDEGPARWTGRIMYRGVSETDAFLTGKTHVAIGGRKTFVAYPISPEHLRAGKSLTNWIAGIHVPVEEGYKPENWTRQAEVEKVASWYDGWDFGWIDVPGIINEAKAVYEYPMIDKDPLDRWSFGGVTLLGDAAHPMYPVGSNGASQAILDAERLTQALTTASSVAEAFAVYESDRRIKTKQIVESNRKGGPEGIIAVAEERAPNGFKSVDEVFEQGEIESFMARYKQVAQFDLQKVNL
ncbi:flavin-dependent oxidoreductase [Pelagibacterium lacus]|uniref:Flavin-dependent oxidoreductase n=1 Tax=Pelagibacterium lacus TaxID=2282655 RepID=A0A369W2X0_9HYPH|nr:flavin-dependent oxidoreductase [Pelagibacterium lacus]RDE08215.1 flavin-dependent oxidoreductase [Pelagibacterium lacus]